MGMASGSPCVIPFWESRVSPSTNISVGRRYVLISRVASGGHTEPSDVMESNLTVQGIECVSGINQEHCFGVTGVKGGSHGAHCNFDARYLFPKYLDTA